MNQQCPKSNLPEVTNISLPCQNVTQMGVVPSLHLHYTPPPPLLGHLHLALPEDKFSRSIDEVYFV
jgi:hypothetical protein